MQKKFLLSFSIHPYYYVVDIYGSCKQPDLLPLQHAWAKANYELEGEAQLEAFLH